MGAIFSCKHVAGRAPCLLLISFVNKWDQSMPTSPRKKKEHLGLSWFIKGKGCVMNLTFKWAKQVAVLVSYWETAFSSAFLHARVMKVTALPISRKAGIQEGHSGMEREVEKSNCTINYCCCCYCHYLGDGKESYISLGLWNIKEALETRAWKFLF